MDAERVIAAAQAVETPVAVVDVAAMESNLTAMQARACLTGFHESRDPRPSGGG
jgi:D-serine deaminase-like pyridoxal phosphate-dependent protein